MQTLHSVRAALMLRLLPRNGLGAVTGAERKVTLPPPFFKKNTAPALRTAIPRFPTARNRGHRGLRTRFFVNFPKLLRLQRRIPKGQLIHSSHKIPHRMSIPTQRNPPVTNLSGANLDRLANGNLF